MATILVTGTSGFVGNALANHLASSGAHKVICMSRKPTACPGATCLRGVFSSFEDLRQLDQFKIDVCVHLAAVTGGCREEDGLLVNVEGTRKLMRYLIDRGCRKFVNASSIAAVGMQSPSFRPLQVPIPDEHPCLDRDGYGLSKYLMEEVTKYLWRQNPAIDVINIRLASVVPDDAKPTPRKVGPATQWCEGSISLMFLADAVRLFRLAAEAAAKPGVRIMNAVAPKANVADTIPEILAGWYGDDVTSLDLSAYEQPGCERDALYDVRRVREELGFVAARNPI